MSASIAYIASPTSPPYVGKQLIALFHTQPLFKYLVYSIATPMINCIFYSGTLRPDSSSSKDSPLY